MIRFGDVVRVHTTVLLLLFYIFTSFFPPSRSLSWHWPVAVPSARWHTQPSHHGYSYTGQCVYVSFSMPITSHHRYSNLGQRACVCQTACSTFPSWGQLYRSESVWLSVCVWTATCSTCPSWGQLYRSVCVCVCVIQHAQPVHHGDSYIGQYVCVIQHAQPVHRGDSYIG